MKRCTLVISSLVATLLFFAGVTTRADAHRPPSPDGGGAVAGYTDLFSASHLLKKAFRTTAAVPCVDAPSGGLAGPYECKNIDLAAYLPTGSLVGGTNSDIWGWTDTTCGRDYALLGMSEATVFVDVTIPEAPVIRGQIPFPRQTPPGSISPGTLWREIKVYGNHAYIVQDLLGSGVQIFDLTRLRWPAAVGDCGPAPVATPSPIPEFDSDAVYTQQGSGPAISWIHTITINEATGFAYLNGSNTCGSAPHMIDLKPNGAFGPENPRWVGCAGSDGYTHDAQCVVYSGPDTAHQGKEICVLYNTDTLTVEDVTNKSAPVQLERQGYVTGGPGQYTHQGWFTEDQHYIISDDEQDEGSVESDGIPMKTYLWDASDLENLVKIATFTHPDTRTADPSDRLLCIDHNQYVHGNLVYQSDYACGLRIYNLSNLASGTLNEVAYFDTMPGADLSFNIGGDALGDWCNYAFASGTVVTSNITEGLFVLRPRLGPTAVTLASFRGRPTGTGVTLNWRTASETDVLGFHVWRIAKNRRGIVNRTLIPAKALGRAGGATYRFVDRGARRGGTYTYKLQVVNKDGLRAFKSTTTVRVQH